MKNAILLLMIFFLPTSLMAQGIGSQATNPKAKPAIYDPTRNAADDIEKAFVDAAETGRQLCE